MTDRNDHNPDDHNRGDDGTGAAADAVTAAARDWLVRLAAGEPTQADIRRFRAWLDAAPEHRAAFDVERRFWHRLGGLEDAAGPATWADTTQSNSAATATPQLFPRPVRTRRRMALAGGLLAAGIALFAVFAGDIRVGLMADYATEVGARRTVTLPDGSTAQLNTDSAIAVAFGPGGRRVGLLRGEAWFDVAHDPARPFRVAAADGVTEALGTAFVVRTGDRRTVVTVTEGRVAVTAPEGAGAATVRVRRGQTTRYRPGEAPRPPRSVDGAAVAPWRDGVIRIDGMPLDAAIAELDRYRPGRIVLLGDAAAYRPVSGAFDIANIDAAIAGVAATHGLRVTEITPWLMILR